MSNGNSLDSNRKLLLTLIGVGSVGLIALLIGLATSPPPTASDIEASRQIEVTQETSEVIGNTEDASSVQVLRPYLDGDQIAFASDWRTVPAGVDAKVFALNQFLREHPAVPEEAIVTSCTVEMGVANVNFTPEIIAGYGSEDEGILVRGIVRTMAQWPEVQMVRFLRNGDRIDSFGNIDLSVPIPVASERDTDEMVP